MVNSNTPKASLVKMLVCLWFHFGRRHQVEFFLILILMLISSFAEVLSLGAVLPFLGILIAPQKVFDHPWINGLVEFWDINSPEQLILPLTIIFVVAVIISALIRSFLLWVSTKLTSTTGTVLSTKVYRHLLYQPYTAHLDSNSSKLITVIINKINAVVYSVIHETLTLGSSIILLVAITITLIFINPIVASGTIIVFGFSYGLIVILARQPLEVNSQRVASEQDRQLKVVQEGLGGIRDVLLNGTQSTYFKAFHKADSLMRQAVGHNIFITQIPRFAMEALGTILIAIIAYLLTSEEGVVTAVPTLGVLALGAQKMVPALQHSYSAWSTIAGTKASLGDVLNLLEQCTTEEIFEKQPELVPLSFQNSLSFKEVRFRFSNNGPWIIDGFNFSIAKGARVGFVGPTGSGKSTALDLLMGFLIPTEGEFLVDGQSIAGKYVKSWQKKIAHVPQNIYLADITFLENIAFGIPLSKISLDRVRHSARQAQIADFIESNPKGYNTIVGERGVRLSGGQQQRIGIARALYRNANVLVFDEATSALDSNTEKSVMDAIDGLNRDLTILIIAHRFSTVKNCDKIIELEQGCVVAQGSYQQLIERSSSFRKMAEQSIDQN